MGTTIKDGEIELKIPTAKQRNDALIKATKGGEINQTEFLTELLPKCIKTHPWGLIEGGLKRKLESLPYPEYDKIAVKFKKLIEPEEELPKKSETYSTQGKPKMQD